MSGIILKNVNNKQFLAVGEQGTTWTLYIHLTDNNNNNIDLTNYIARSYMKAKYTDKDPVAIFNCSIINPQQGKIQLKLDKNVTKNIVKGKYYMDVEIEDINGNVTRILEGIIMVSPEVTTE